MERNRLYNYGPSDPKSPKGSQNNENNESSESNENRENNEINQNKSNPNGPSASKNPHCQNENLSPISLHACKMDISTQKKRKTRLGQVLPPPNYSACLYVQINPKDIAMFKFLLEAEDNLGYMSVVDRWSAALKVVYSPHQQKAIRAWLTDTAKALKFKEIWLNNI